MADQEETTAIITVEQGTAEVGEVEKPPQYAEQESAAQVTVTVQPKQPDPQVEFRDFPVWITDDKGNRTQTELRYKNGILTWIVMLTLCLICSNFGLCFLCLLPLCMKSMKDVEHVNPVDGTVVGVFHRIQH